MATDDKTNSKPILDLSTLVPERPKVRIDDELHELKVMDEFGVRDQQWLISRTKILEPFFQRDELSEQEETDIEYTVREFASRIASSAPIEKLSTWSCFRLVMFYTQTESFLLAPGTMTEEALTGAN
jgi:hypothetical protein